MDTFFEQIVSIKKSKKTWSLYFFIWIAALLLEVIALLLLLSGFSFAILLMAGIVYGAFKLTGTLNIEYEYIITNGTMDIDQIINKQSRKRILSFDVSKVTRMETYSENLLQRVNTKDIVMACNATEDAYLLVYEKSGKSIYLVFAPDEKMKNILMKYLPKFISNSLFK